MIRFAVCAVLLSSLISAAQTRRPAIVVLSEPSLAEAMEVPGSREHVPTRMFSTEGQVHLAAMQSRKAPLIAQIQQHGLPIRSQTEHVLNAVMLDSTEEELVWLRQQPGVKSAQF